MGPLWQPASQPFLSHIPRMFGEQQGQANQNTAEIGRHEVGSQPCIYGSPDALGRYGSSEGPGNGKTQAWEPCP